MNGPDDQDDLAPESAALLERVVLGELRADAPPVVARAASDPAFRAALAESLALQATLDQAGGHAKAVVAEALPAAQPAIPRRAAGSSWPQRLTWLAAASFVLAVVLRFVNAPDAAEDPVDPELKLGAGGLSPVVTAPFVAGMRVTWAGEPPAGGNFRVTIAADPAGDAPPLVRTTLRPEWIAGAEEIAVFADADAIRITVDSRLGDGTVAASGTVRCARPR